MVAPLSGFEGRSLWSRLVRRNALHFVAPLSSYLQFFYKWRRIAANVVPDNGVMPRTVLIVEDVEACAATLEIAFSAVEGIEVVTVMGAEEAWRVVDATGDLGAIVTDLQMGGMDGFELIERVRAHGRHGGVPIVVITGSSDPDAPERVRRLGANAFFTKPYSAALVREKLEQLLHDLG